MPRHFFDVYGERCKHDQCGVELADVAAAKIVATSFAACLLKEDPKCCWDDGGWQVRVRGDGGTVLFEIVVAMSVAVAQTEARLNERAMLRRSDVQTAARHC